MVVENVDAQVQLVQQAVGVLGSAGHSWLLHVPGRRAGAPGEEVAGRIGVETEIGVRLVDRILVQFGVQPAVVVHGIKLQERAGVQHAAVAAQVGGNLAAAPPYLQLIGYYARNIGLRQVLKINLVQSITDYFHFIVLLLRHNPLIARGTRLGPRGSPAQHQCQHH